MVAESRGAASAGGTKETGRTPEAKPAVDREDHEGCEGEVPEDT